MMLAGTMTGWGWGQKGHDVTAFIAENHLTPRTKVQISELLDGKSIVYWANWLDNASHTPEFAHTKTWHYKNIDEGVDYEDVAPFKTGDVVTAVNGMVDVLTDPTKSREAKQLALKILVHVMGDLHQPMHTGHATDLGGNKVKVKFFGKDTNLHSAWDSSVVESAHKWTYTEWQQQLDRLPASEVEVIQMGTADDWCKNTSAICGVIYKHTPEGTDISYDYVGFWAPVVEQQLLYGGLRLADVLNGIFDPNYRRKSSVVK